MTETHTAITGKYIRKMYLYMIDLPVPLMYNIPYSL